MHVLVIGSGAREHALVCHLADDPGVAAVTCVPGNPGTAAVTGQAMGISMDIGDITDGPAVAALARNLAADLVVVGPEGPLVAGVADAVRRAGIPCFGPSAAAARIEGSKAFAKEVMAAAAVPTAASRTCVTKEEASAALDAYGPPYVVKDDGLAGGKGVVVTEDRATAESHAASCGRVVIEEYLQGPEASVFALTDGATVRVLRPARDYKRAGDGDTGPNTGGMGAYSPLPLDPPGLADDVSRIVIQPAVDELRRRGCPYTGLLYAGVALTPAGPRVVEFNARFGDPETQVVLAGLDSPLGALLDAAARGRLHEVNPPRWRDEAAVTVVVAAEGYPQEPVRGDVIDGIAEAEAVPGVFVLHAGTERGGRAGQDQLVSAGGRVLSVTALGSDVSQARERAYEAVSRIRMRGACYRTDIGPVEIR